MQAQILESILASTAEGIAVADAGGKLLLLNPAGERILGMGILDVPPEERARAYGLYLPDQVTLWPAEQMPLRRALRGESVDNVTIFVRNHQRPEGLWISASSRPMRDERGDIIGVVITFRDIAAEKHDRDRIESEQKQAAQALQESEERFRTMTEVALAGVYIIQDEVFRYANPAMAHMFGYEPGEIIDKLGPPDLTHPNSRPLVAHHLHLRMKENLSGVHYEFQGLRKDGGIIHCEVFGRRMDYRGRPAIVGMLLDITDRRRAEQDLRRERDFNKCLVDTSPAFITSIDSQGRILMMNQAMLRAVGYRLEEVEGRDYLPLLIPPEERAAVGQVFQRLVAAREAVVSENTILTRDGRRLITEWRGQPVFRPSGDLDYIFGIGMDIAERREAEQKVARSLSLLRATLDSTADGILVVDLAGRIVSHNRKFAQLWNIPEPLIAAGDDRAVLQSVLDQVKNPADFLSGVQTLYQTPEMESFDVLEFKDGRVFERYSQPQRLAGQVVGRVWSFRDITARRRAERQLLQAQKLESIGTLASGIAHDFNNLLAVILGNASVHLRDKNLPPKLRDSLADITTAAERGSTLTHQLLAFARGGLQTLGATHLNHLVQSVLQILRRTTPPQIEFALDLAETLPAITADPGQIEQVLMNLLLNAVQASQEPSTVKLVTRAETLNPQAAGALELAPGRYARLRIQDQGCGMDARTAERIFEPFFSTKFAGRGMGLAATLGIIHSHHGQIRVESAPGQGTSMTVWLPIAGENAAPAPVPSPGPRRTLPTGSETVLVLDDDPAVNRAVEQMLTSLGYCVVGFTRPDQAGKFLAENSGEIDLILLDLNMPAYTAEDLYQRLSAACPRAPILLASGFETTAVVQSLLERGAAGFLHKPFSLGTLAKAVRKTLEEKRGRKTTTRRPRSRRGAARKAR